MNILWIFHLILKCINVHLTLSPCLSVFYSELVKQVVASMLSSIILPLIFKYSFLLGLQIKDSLLNTDTFSMIDFAKRVDFSYTVLPVCVCQLWPLFLLLCSTDVCLKPLSAWCEKCTLNFMTNYTHRKFLISNIKYLCPETIAKASDYVQNS